MVKTRSRQARQEAWRATAEQLECAGWQVRWRRAWVVEARREHHCEQGIGQTLDEAFAELQQMVRLDQWEGCP
jgi:hypothetical protein